MSECACVSMFCHPAIVFLFIAAVAATSAVAVVISSPIAQTLVFATISSIKYYLAAIDNSSCELSLELCMILKLCVQQKTADKNRTSIFLRCARRLFSFSFAIVPSFSSLFIISGDINCGPKLLQHQQQQHHFSVS